jgi:hypothetical protein
MTILSSRVHNAQDIIDSRDIIERIEELTDTDDSEEREELQALQALASEAESSPDWAYGAALIRDSYFRDYAQELAEDCGMLKDCDTWPARCIDWDQAARELQMDYFPVDFDGVTYWIRG